MGFLSNSSIGFGNIVVSGSSSNVSSGYYEELIYKETSSEISVNERHVASREAVQDITYTLPNKDDIPGNFMFEVINMNTEFNIYVVDAQNSAIDDANPFTVDPGVSITFLLDKKNLSWRSIGGI